MSTLKSPIAGELDSLNCQLGQTLSPGTAIGEVVDIGKLAVVVWLPSRDASRIAVGQTAHVSCGALAETPKPAADADDDEAPPDDNSAAGAVTFVGHIADPQTGNLPVQIVMENSEGRFAVGQVVSVDITVNEKTDVLAAPIAALFDVGDGTVIDIIRDGKSVKVQPDLGIRDKHWVEIAGVDIKEPPKASELAIVEGGYNLPDGTAVKVEEKSADDAKSPTESKATDETKPKDEKSTSAESKQTVSPAPEGRRAVSTIIPGSAASADLSSAASESTDAAVLASNGEKSSGVAMPSPLSKAKPQAEIQSATTGGRNLVAIARPYFGLIVLSTLLLSAWGIVAMFHMPSGIYPEVSFPQIAVIVETPALGIRDVRSPLPGRSKNV